MIDEELKDMMDPDIYKALYGRQDELVKRSQMEEKRLLQDIEFVFSTEEGRRVLQFIMEICRINSSTFTGNSMTYYLEGAQDVGKALKRKIMAADPEIYFAVERKVWQEEKDAMEKRV